MAGQLAAFSGALVAEVILTARSARLGQTSSRPLVLRAAGANADVRECDGVGGRGLAGGGLRGGPGAAWHLFCGLWVRDPPAGSARHGERRPQTAGAGDRCIFCGILAMQVIKTTADTYQSRPTW